MRLEGKTIDFLGDSITFGYGVSRDRRFTDILSREYRLKCAENYGENGTRIAKQKAPDPAAFEDCRDFCARACEMNRSADVCVVFGGVNDYQHGDAPMGGAGDRTPETFRGALFFLYSLLKKEFNSSKKLIVTPLHMLGDEKKGGRYPLRKEPLVLADYVKEIKKAAELFGYPVLDLFSREELDPNREPARRNFLPDCIHPNENGHKLIAKLLGEFIEKSL